MGHGLITSLAYYNNKKAHPHDALLSGTNTEEQAKKREMVAQSLD